MRWFKRASHGDTTEGQLFKGELSRIRKQVKKLLANAGPGGPESVLPRWRADVRRAILLLPVEERIARMSMIELQNVSNDLAEIEAKMSRYSVARTREIMGI
jgi:hypothetical protein